MNPFSSLPFVALPFAHLVFSSPLVLLHSGILNFHMLHDMNMILPPEISLVTVLPRGIP